MAVAPELVWEALVTSYVVLQGPRVNWSHYRYAGGVHLNSMKRWRVKAVGSPAHNSLFPQTVAVVRFAPS